MRRLVAVSFLVCFVLAGCALVRGSRKGSGAPLTGVATNGESVLETRPGTNAVTVVTKGGAVTTTAKGGTITTTAGAPAVGGGVAPGGVEPGEAVGGAAPNHSSLFYFYLILGIALFVWLVLAVWHRLSKKKKRNKRGLPTRLRVRQRHA